MEKERIKPITLEIEKEVWEKFKSKVTRDRTLNQAIEYLIEKYNEKERNNCKS